MQKFNRATILAVTLLTVCAPIMHAEQLGTNPKPPTPKGQSVAVQTVLTLLSVFGM